MKFNGKETDEYNMYIQHSRVEYKALSGYSPNERFKMF